MKAEGFIGPFIQYIPVCVSPLYNLMTGSICMYSGFKKTLWCLYFKLELKVIALNLIKTIHTVMERWRLLYWNLSGIENEMLYCRGLDSSSWKHNNKKKIHFGQESPNMDQTQQTFMSFSLANNCSD